MSDLGERRRLKRVPTGFNVAAVTIALILIAQLTLVLWARNTTEKGFETALRDSFAYVADVSEERVLSYVTDAESSNQEVLQIVTDTGLEPVPLATNLYQELKASPTLQAISVTRPDGSLVIVRRSEVTDGGYFSRWIEFQDSGVATQGAAEHDGDFAVIDTDIAPLTFDPLTVDHYVTALRSEGQVWTEPTLRPVTMSPGIWVAEAHRDASGEVQFVVATDLLLDELGVALNDLPFGGNGEAFLMTGSRSVIAAPQEYRAELAGYAKENQEVADATVLGVFTTSPSITSEAGQTFGKNGELVTLERHVMHQGIDWVIHLRATEAAISPAVTSVNGTVGVLIALMLVVILAAAYVAVTLWKPVGQMRRDADHDALTGLYNRRHFDKVGQNLLRNAHRSGCEHTFVMLDLDNFKELNDARGHEAGDRALVAVAQAIQSEVRADDLAFRWGGDEFMVVLVRPKEASLARTVERIRLHVELALELECGRTSGLGVTVGYATCGSPNARAAEVVARADEALMRGKKLAKSRVYSAPAV